MHWRGEWTVQHLLAHVAHTHICNLQPQVVGVMTQELNPDQLLLEAYKVQIMEA